MNASKPAATLDQQPTLPICADVPLTQATSSSAIKKRAGEALLAMLWSIQALLPKLPLLFPVEADLPPSPKTRYRSQYRYLGPEPLLDPTRLATLADFEIALYLIDFSPLERMLAAVYVPSLKGQVPYHPVSMFLCILLRRENNLSWRALARLLAGQHGEGWRRLLGFDKAKTPSPSGLRHFFHAVGPSVFDDLCPRFVTLLRQHGLFPETSTYPGDPPGRGITVTQDGMLHPARSRPSCELAEDTCYQPVEVAKPESTPGPPEPGASRPCRAHQHGGEGCACDTSACQEQCRRASRLDPEARFIHYDGRNAKRGQTGQDESQARSAEEGKGRGTNVFGYRSVAERALDERFAVAWTLRSDVYPANTDERTVFPERFKALFDRSAHLKVGEVILDSGLGYGECLEAIWQVGALRMVDIRADRSDDDPEACLRRGYDGQGRPLCPHGYPLRSNGYDFERRRTKYVCAQVCRREPLGKAEAVRPVEGCPYLDEAKPLGQVVNVGKTLPDGSLRLAREVPYGSETWQARYGRRNNSESRNGQLEGLGLKRMQSYGLSHNAKEVQVADFLINLRTLGRLVREATDLRVT